MVEKIMLICLSVLLMSGGGLALYAGVKYKIPEIHKTLPPGFVFLCNEAGKYRWSNDEWRQGFSSSKKDCIENAWAQYNDNVFTKCE